MYGHKLVAEQIWVLVQARYHLLAETLRRKMHGTEVNRYQNDGCRIELGKMLLYALLLVLQMYDVFLR